MTGIRSDPRNQTTRIMEMEFANYINTKVTTALRWVHQSWMMKIQRGCKVLAVASHQ